MAARTNAYERLIRFLGPRRLFAVSAAVVAPLIDRALYRWTGARLQLTGRVPTLLLTTVGRKSGIARRQPVHYLRDGERLVLAATNWGKKRHPAWSSNLLANPSARVEIGGVVRDYLARQATPDERAALAAAGRALARPRELSSEERAPAPDLRARADRASCIR